MNLVRVTSAVLIGVSMMAGLAACGEKDEASSSAPAAATTAATTDSSAAAAAPSDKEICTTVEEAASAYGSGLIALGAKAPIDGSKKLLNDLAASLTKAAGTGDTATAEAVKSLAANVRKAAEDPADPIAQYDNDAKTTLGRTLVNTACEESGVDTAL